MSNFDNGFARAQREYENRMPPEYPEEGICECGRYHGVDEPSDDACEDFRFDPHGHDDYCREMAAEQRFDMMREEGEI